VDVRILVIDDEPAIRQLLSRALTSHGFSVDTAPDAAAGLDLVQRSTYDVVVLDVVMPGTTGTEVLPKMLETSPGQNVVMLSALGDPRVKVRCLELGAVDYVTKPFTLAELIARLRVHGRRGTSPVVEPVRVERRRGERRVGDRRHGSPPVDGASDTNGAGGWVRSASASLDLRGRRLHTQGRVIALSEREALLLAHLLRRPGQAVTREELLSAVWGPMDVGSANVVDVYVGRLRAKLGADSIQTIRRVGYAYVGG
jgi:two-component system OmpR family response regulator